MVMIVVLVLPAVQAERLPNARATAF